MEKIIFIAIIVFVSFDYALQRFLEYKNSQHRSSAIPAILADIYNSDEYIKQQNYEATKFKSDFWASTIGVVFTLTLLLVDGFAYIDSFVYTTFGSDTAPLDHIWGGLLFFGVITLLTGIISLPFQIYDTFVVEEKFGFNKMTPKLFVLDLLKSTLLTAIVGGALLAAILALIMYFEGDFWIYAWALIAVFMIVITMFYSNIIVPLFNKQTPLEDGELKDAIVEFSKKVGFKLDNIFVIDGSKRSTKANAYFSGLGSKKRIVLYDTLIQEMTTNEIVAVLAHEIGHYKKKHTRSMIFASVLQIGFILYVLGLCINAESLTLALGISPESGKFHIALFVFSFLYAPLSFVIGILFNIFSRKNEYEADAYAAKHFSAVELENALKKLSKRNLSNLTPHPWYIFFYYSHPSLYQRLVALRNEKK